jgi:cytochrome c oxidase subunit III
MSHSPSSSSAAPASGYQSFIADLSSDQRAFKGLSWPKMMMWVFLLGDIFVFSCFLIAYMNLRTAVQAPWPHPTEVFALKIAGKEIPLLLVAVMTLVLTSSCGTMSLAVAYGFQKNRAKALQMLWISAALGLMFVAMQAFEWTKLIGEGVRPWANGMGASQFGAFFFMITGFHGTHVTIGVILILFVAGKVARGELDDGVRSSLTHRKQSYELVEILSLYWHFVDVVWVFLFAVFYLW